MKNFNILIADDEKSVTTTLSFVLKRVGHAVDAVPDGGDALTRIEERPGHYQILITDHLMVNVSGLELVEQLRKIPFQGKIMVLSGNLTVQLEEQYRKFGVDKFIHKPFDVDELRKAVEELGATSPLTGCESAH